MGPHRGKPTMVKALLRPARRNADPDAGRRLFGGDALPKGCRRARQRRGQGRRRDMPIHDFFADRGQLRVDGRMVHDMYLVEVKRPDESRYPWDYYKILRTIPGEEAFRPMSEGGCPLLAKP